MSPMERARFHFAALVSALAEEAAAHGCHGLQIYGGGHVADFDGLRGPKDWLTVHGLTYSRNTYSGIKTDTVTLGYIYPDRVTVRDEIRPHRIALRAAA